MNNPIKRTWNQGSMVNIEDLRGMTFQAESGAHTFVISAVDANNNPITLSGTPSGTMLRPDNTDQALTCSVSGGKVYATLPAGCYDVPGRAGITIFLTSDGQKVAIYAAVVSVTRTQSGTASPGTTASVVDLVNAIAAAVATIPASYTDLMAAVAPTYSSSGLYAVGSYAWYSGKLYRCTTAITTAETWTAAHWTLANLGSDLADLKSAIVELRGRSFVNNSLVDPSDMTVIGYINTNGNLVPSATNYRTTNSYIELLDGVDAYAIRSATPVFISQYDSSKDRLQSYALFDCGNFIPLQSAKYIKLSCEDTQVSKIAVIPRRKIYYGDLIAKDSQFVTSDILSDLYWTGLAASSDNALEGYCSCIPIKQDGVVKRVQFFHFGSADSISTVRIGLFRYNIANGVYSCVKSVSTNKINLYRCGNNSAVIQYVDCDVSDKNMPCLNGDFVGLFIKEGIGHSGLASYTNQDERGSWAGFCRVFKSNTNNPQYYMLPSKNELKITAITALIETGERYNEYEAGINPSEYSSGGTNYSGSMFIFPEGNVKKDVKLVGIRYYSGSQSNKTVNIAVGTHDQLDRFVWSKTFSFPVAPGYNYIGETTLKDIIILSGQTVAISVDSNDVYISDSGAIDAYKYGCFNSLEDYDVSELSGNGLFSYIVKEIPEENEINALIKNVNTISNYIDNVKYRQLLISPNGSKYYVSVSNNGTLIVESESLEKFLAIGNSITYHPINASVNWYSPWGMAASKEQYDYVHRIGNYADIPNVTAYNLMYWEYPNRSDSLAFIGQDSATRDDYLFQLDNYLSSDLDLITIALGENSNDDSTLQADFESMIDYIRQRSPHARIVMIGMIFPSASRDAAKRAAAEAKGIDFVDLSGYNTLPGFRSAIGTVIYKPDNTTYTVTNSGVAAHPSDYGMKCIAEQTLRVLFSDPSINLDN